MDAKAAQPLREQGERGAVDDLVHHDLVAALQQRKQGGGNGCHAGCGHDAGFGPFQRRQPLFQQRLRGVARAAIDIALLFTQADLVEGFDAVLSVGGRQVQRRRQSALFLQRVVPQVDGAGGKALLRGVGHS
ncbi:hypothetical protein G6F22_011685 [Rhizopus arrhizus]|nr:hypothetical protein G6F22_011685 [Rhizopus arrhizus]